MSQSTINKFFGGKEPPDKKTKVSDKEKQKNRKDYEANERKRTFIASWKDGRPWLQFDTVNGTIKCNFCTKYCPSKDNNFIVGCKDLKLYQNLRIKNKSDAQKDPRIEPFCRFPKILVFQIMPMVSSGNIQQR